MGIENSYQGIDDYAVKIIKYKARQLVGRYGLTIYPIVAKAGGLQSQGAEGAAVVNLLQALGNAGSGVLRLSRRGKEMA